MKRLLLWVVGVRFTRDNERHEIVMRVPSWLASADRMERMAAELAEDARVGWGAEVRYETTPRVARVWLVDRGRLR